jgi:hypothetical protein
MASTASSVALRGDYRPLNESGLVIANDPAHGPVRKPPFP